MADIFKGSSVWRMILDSETDADSPDSEELNSQLRENMEGLLISFGYTGHGGSINTISTGSTSVISCTTAIATAVNVHNGRRCIITSGSGKGNFYPISTHGTTYLTLPGADVEADGVSTGDDFLVFYDFATDAHDHDGVNSKSALLGDGAVTETKIGTGAVAQSKLKTSTGSVSVQCNDSSYWNWSLLTLPGGEYGFYPRLKLNVSTGNVGAASLAFLDSTAGIIVSTSYVTSIHLGAYRSGYTSGYYTYANQRYVTSSGEVFWMFILREKVTKKIVSMSCAPDHPCFGNGGKPLLVPHPFGSYDPEIHEIIVINPTEDEVAEMKDKTLRGEDEPDRDLLEVIVEDYEIDEASNPKWPDKEVTVGLPPDRGWKREPDGTPVVPIKRRIPQPDYIICKSLKEK